MAEVNQSPTDPLTAGPPQGARCLNCRYLLEGLPRLVCPECGRAFDAADPSSYCIDPPKRLLDWGLGPQWAAAPHNWELALCAVILLGVIWRSMSTVQGAAPSFILSWYVPLGGFWLMRVQSVRRFGAADGGARRWRSRGRWLALPLCITLALVAGSKLDLMSRFSGSRQAFELRALQVMAQGQPQNAAEWVGWVYCERIGLTSDGRVIFQVPDAEAHQREKPAFVRSSAPPGPGVTSLGQPWYFQEDPG